MHGTSKQTAKVLAGETLVVREDVLYSPMYYTSELDLDLEAIEDCEIEIKNIAIAPILPEGYEPSFDARAQAFRQALFPRDKVEKNYQQFLTNQLESRRDLVKGALTRRKIIVIEGYFK